MSCGNFLQVASARCGLQVEFGKMLLLYAEKTAVPLSELNATDIQAAIADGTIIGIIRNWNMVAGASVAEKNTERSEGEKFLMREEILGDIMTFEDNITNNRVMSDLVKGGTFQALMIGDKGGVYGEETLEPATINTMKVNFSNKVSNGLQYDKNNEKIVTVNILYFVEKIAAIDANVEVEEIVSKIPLRGKISAITSQTTSAIVFKMDLFDETTGLLLTAFTTTSLEIDVVVGGNAVTASAAFAANQLTITLAKTVADFSTTDNKLKVKFNTPEYYLEQIEFSTSTFA